MCASLLRNSIKCINLRINASAVNSRYICTSSSSLSLRRGTTEEVENKLLRGDNLPEHYRLVYRAPLENYVAWSKNVSTGTVSVIGLFAGYKWGSATSYENIANTIEINDLLSKETDLYYFAVGFVLINLAIRYLVAKYPLRIYNSGDKYVAVFGSQWPVGTVKHFFERGQISEYHNAINPWSNIMYKLGRRSAMLLIDYFKSPSEFNKLFEEKQT